MDQKNENLNIHKCKKEPMKTERKIHDWTGVRPKTWVRSLAGSYKRNWGPLAPCLALGNKDLT